MKIQSYPIASVRFCVRLCMVVLLAGIALVAHAQCAKPVYLTFDTGNMSVAQLVADTLNKHAVKATFFLANEKTNQGNYALDQAWAPYWRARVAEGHAFGSHTFDHVYFQSDLVHSRFKVKPQFGKQAARTQIWNGAKICEEIKRSQTAFLQLLQANPNTDNANKINSLAPMANIWRAPGGKGSAAYFEAARQCGWTHVGWSPAGFLGDELSSQTHPNAQLLQRALQSIEPGDVVMAHLGIWSRKDPFAPMLDPLIAGLKKRGMCFATLLEHPQVKSRAANMGW